MMKETSLKEAVMKTLTTRFALGALFLAICWLATPHSSWAGKEKTPRNRIECIKFCEAGCRNAPGAKFACKKRCQRKCKEQFPSVLD